MVDTKIAYAVWEAEYEESPDLVTVFESKKEADDYAEKSNNEGNYRIYFVKPVQYKPKEIW